MAIVYTGLKQLKLISLRQGALEVSGPIPRFRTSDIMVWSSVCVHVCVSTCVRLCLHIHISQHSNMSCADQPSLGMSIMMIHYGTLSTKAIYQQRHTETRCDQGCHLKLKDVTECPVKIFICHVIQLKLHLLHV